MAGKKASKTSVTTPVSKKAPKGSASKSTAVAGKASKSKTTNPQKPALKKTSEKKATTKKAVKSVANPTKTPVKNLAKKKSATAKPVVKSTSKSTSKTRVEPEPVKKSVKKTPAKSAANVEPVKKTAVKKTTPKGKKVAMPEPVKKSTVKKAEKQTGTKPVSKTPKVEQPVKKTQPAAKPQPVKKTQEAAKPQPVAKPKSKNPARVMTKQRQAAIELIRQELEARRIEIISSLRGGLETENPTHSSGDAGDVAIDSVHSEMRFQMAEKESQELATINNALHKMDLGEYGFCEECGDPIPLERLEALPDAELCLKCQMEEEADGYDDDYDY